MAGGLLSTWEDALRLHTNEAEHWEYRQSSPFAPGYDPGLLARAYACCTSITSVHSKTFSLASLLVSGCEITGYRRKEQAMKRYDIILAGGGAAGLSLACHLAQSPLRAQKILMVEQQAKDHNDHTWCFWARQPTLFDTIVSCSWSQLQVLQECFTKTLKLRRYRYKMIRGDDFYRFAAHIMSTSSQVERLRGKIERIEDGEQTASVLVDGQCYTGTWVFDSVTEQAEPIVDQAPYHTLEQQFKGKEITTLEHVFDPQVATLLDFRTSQKSGARFFYVLPFSKNHALVEGVFYTKESIQWEICERALNLYNVQRSGRAYRRPSGIAPH